jgi:cell division protein FtsB
VKLLAAALVAMLIAIQWPLWFGRGGWLRVWELQRQLDSQRAANAASQARNEGLAAEISSLKQGREAIEERARGELHMMRADETFFQWLPAAPAEPKTVDGK